MEDEESLKTSAVVGELADAIEDVIDNLLSDGVVTTSVVVGGILLAVDDLLGMVELPVRSVTDFVTDSRLEIDIDSTRDMLASASLAEEGVESIIALSGGLVMCAWSHQAQCHARGSKAPSSCYQSGYQPGPSGSRCILV